MELRVLLFFFFLFFFFSHIHHVEIKKLASCPWGPATAHGVGLLTEMYAIYMERYASHRAMKSIGPTALPFLGFDTWMDGQFAGNIYGFLSIMDYEICKQHSSIKV